MRFFRHVLFLALAFVLLFHSTPGAAQGSRKENSGPRILWAFGAVRSSSTPPKVEPVTNHMVLSSGDKLKMMVQMRKKCFVYLIHRDSQGDFNMLFPYSLKQFDTDYQVAHNYYAPRGQAWFQLDSRTGEETFYLIASDQRLLNVEYTYEKYASSEEPRKKDLAAQMLAELDKVTERHLVSSEGVEKLAVANGSSARGFERAAGADPTDVAVLAREISFDNIYSETFVVEHR